MAEYSPVEDLFFGYANLGDSQLAGWGLIPHEDLRRLRVGPGIEADRDLHWTPRKVREIAGIRM